MLASRFSVIKNSMEKKNYSFLELRRNDFDADYDEFCQQIAALHVSQIPYHYV